MSAAESWCAIPGFPGYEASSEGQIRSWHRNGPRLLSPFVSHGYLRVTLVPPDGRKHKRAVHTLVALAHVDPFPEEGHEVAHLDGDRQNCAAWNLAWVSHAENCAHKAGHGTLRVGDNHPSTRLTSELRERAFAAIRAGESAASVARAYEVTAGYLRRLYAQHSDRLELDAIDCPI